MSVDVVEVVRDDEGDLGKKIAKLNKPLVNRIVGHGEEAVDQLLANPLNFRLHPDNQQQALAGAIDDIGFIRSVTVNQRTGRVVDGHLRVTLAARSGVTTLPVEYVDLDEAEEAQALLSLDPIAAMAASDKAKLDELMRAVQSDDERVQAMIAEIAEREDLKYEQIEETGNTEIISEQYMILIECDNEQNQAELLEQFNEQNLKCRALIS